MGKCDGVYQTDLFRHSVTEPEGPPEPFSLYSTLPRSMRETKLVTNVKVEEDEEVLRARQELVQNRTPAQLSAITSISDLPVPSKLTKMMKRDHSAPATATATATAAVVEKGSRTPRWDLILCPNFFLDDNTGLFFKTEFLQQNEPERHVLHPAQVADHGARREDQGSHKLTLQIF